MTVAQTSILAYRDPDVQSKRMSVKRQVYEFIKANYNCTMAMFCNHTGMQPHRVSGRFGELVNEKKIIVTGEVHDRLCNGRLAQTYAVAENSITTRPIEV